MYIVTYRWIDACLKSNRILNEKPFEIQGDLTLSSDHNGLLKTKTRFFFIIFDFLRYATKSSKCFTR